MAFMSAGPPEGEHLDPLLSRTDVAPTAFSALGEPLPEGLDGVDLWESEPESIRGRVIRSEIWNDPDSPLMGYQATSGWTEDGGVVRHLNSAVARLGYMLGYEYYFASYANVVRRPSRETPAHWLAYLKPTNVYGDPPSSVVEVLPEEFSTEPPTEAVFVGPDEAQLRALGYLE